MFLISVLGAMVAPVMVFIGLIKSRFDDPNMIIKFEDMFAQTNLYVLLLFGAIVYAVIATYLFSREYTENTLKNILSIPVSKTKLIVGKFIMLYIWILILTAVAFITTFILSCIGGAVELSIEVIIKFLKQYFIGASLLFLTLTPFVFIGIWLKNIVPTIILVATISMINVALSNEDLTALFPWSAVYVIASEQVIPKYPIYLSYLAIVGVSVIGFVASIIYFKNQDVK